MRVTTPRSILSLSTYVHFTDVFYHPIDLTPPSSTVGKVTFSGPQKTIMAQEGASTFVECLPVTGVQGPYLVHWRLSEAAHSPVSLPSARFQANSTGLIINPVCLEDHGTTVQCYIIHVDPNVVPANITMFNSSIGVIHVEASQHALSTTQAPSYGNSISTHSITPTPTISLTPTPDQTTGNHISTTPTKTAIGGPHSITTTTAAAIAIFLTAFLILCITSIILSFLFLSESLKQKLPHSTDKHDSHSPGITTKVVKRNLPHKPKLVIGEVNDSPQLAIHPSVVITQLPDSPRLVVRQSVLLTEYLGPVSQV